MSPDLHQYIPGLLARLGRRLWRWLWRATALGLIAAAVLLTLARLLLPFAAEYRAEVEQRVEAYLGAEVSIGGLDIDWHGLGPRMQLSDLRIHDLGPGKGSIAFERAFVSLRPVLVDGMPGLRIGDFSLIGFTLEARVDEQGRLHAFGRQIDPAELLAAPAAGAANTGGEGTGGEADGPDAGRQIRATAPPSDLLERVFSIRRLQLREVTLAVTMPDDRELRWRDAAFMLHNAGNEHSLSLEVAPPPGWGERLAGRLEFTGAPAAYHRWRATLYVEARDLALKRLSALWPGAPVRATEGRLDLRLWSDWDGGRLLEANAEVGADRLELARADVGRNARFERIAGRLRLWQPSPDQWQLDAGGLEVRRNDRAWRGGNISYALEDDGDWRVAADFLRNEDIAAVAGLLPLGDTLRGHLERAAPRGDLHGLRLAVGDDGDFRLRGDFRDLGWRSIEDIPGMSGLDGRIRFRAGGGHIALESTGVGFEAPRLFRDPLHLQELSATIALEPVGSGFRLNAPRIHARNEDLRGRGRARIEWSPGESPLLDLQFDYRNGVAVSVPRYLPAGIMPDPVVEWLDRAFLGGRVPRGSFILRGRADDFPYREHRGVFDVRFDVADATLHYADDWPAIEQLHGRVHFAGPALDIAAERGGTRDLRLRQGHARFADLEEGLLQVDLDADGPLADMLGVVRDSPLRQDFAPVLEDARAAGEAGLSLALSVPVEHPDDTRVDGEVRLAGASLEQPRHDLAFEQLQGSIRFSERSVAIEDLRARARGRPLRLDADTRDGVGHFRARADLAPLELLPALAGGPLADSGGRSAWEIGLSVPLTAEGRPRLEAASDLAGTRIGLPHPLGKAADEVRPLRLSMPLDGSIARLRYGEDTRLALDLADGDGLGVRRAALAFSGDAVLPPAPGLRVSGRLGHVDAAPWLSFMTGNGRGGDGGDALPLHSLDLRTDRLDYRGYRLSDARLQGERGDGGSWHLAIAGNEADGTIDWPAGTGATAPVEIRFEWIDLALMTLPEGAAGDDDTTRPTSLVDPAALPSLDLRVDRLKFTDFTLEDFIVVTGAGRRGATIHQLGFETGSLRVTGQGKWLGGGEPRTSLRMVLRSGNFGDALTELGHGGLLADGDGSVTLDLEWPGGPWQPELATIAGHAEIEIEDGILTEVDPGAARLLGLFWLEAMPFRTLLQSGLIFSELKGRVDFEAGNAYTNLLKIDSAVGLIKLYGRTGLVARDYDQRIVVLPELSTSLPVIGFLSGGPLAGVAVALFQGLMRNIGSDIEQAGRIEYTVTGSWDDPVIERVQLDAPDDNAALRRETPR